MSTLTAFALVRRHPEGGFTVVHGYVELSTVPKVDPEIHSTHLTLQHACDAARSDGLYSVHPECYRPANSLMKGLFA